MKIAESFPCFELVEVFLSWMILIKRDFALRSSFRKKLLLGLYIPEGHISKVLYAGSGLFS